MPPRQGPARLASKRSFSASIVIVRRARLLVVCAMLSLPRVDGALAADPQIKPPIRGLVSMGAYRFVGQGGDPVNTLEPLNASEGRHLRRPRDHRELEAAATDARLRAR
jgi:hypothetical protein